MIYFVRHGETDFNLQKIYAGRTNIPLNQRGVVQAKVTAAELKDIKFDVCFCSPLLRAVQTCDEILKFHPETSVITDARLMERNYGDLEKKSKLNLTYNLWLVGEDEKGKEVYNIETIAEISKRVSDFYNEILPKYKNKNILIVAHSGIGRVSEAYFHGAPKNNDYSKIRFSNAEVAVFDDSLNTKKEKCSNNVVFGNG